MLAGCSYALKQQVDQRYTAFIGRTIADAVITFGPPATQIDTGPTTRAFQWNSTGRYQTTGTVNNIGGTVFVRPGAQIDTNCRVTFIASAPSRTDDLSQWRIHRYEWNASDMRTCQ